MESEVEVMGASRQDTMRVRIGNRWIGGDEPVFIVGEEGQANDGNIEIAKQMIEVAAQAKADAVEFQLAIADDFYIRQHPNYAVYKRREFDRSELSELFATGRELGVLVYAAPLSSRLVEILANLGCPLFTVNASDLNNPALLDAVAETKHPLFVSTAMAELEEIDWALERLRRRNAQDIVLLHGQHVMASGDGRGVPEDHVNLASIPFLRRHYGLPVGFIDHTSNPLMPMIAASSGACVVTKHFTVSRARKGPDWHICLEPEELAEMVRQVRLTDATRGMEGKRLAEGEAADKTQMRRSIVAATQLSAGTLLAPEHLCFKRPGTGLAPSRVEELIGRRLKVALAADDPLRLEDIK